MAANIVLLDIETAPNVGYVWGKYDQNVIDFLEDGYMLSFAYKCLGHSGVTVRALPDYKGYKPGGGDYHLIADLWSVLDGADIVVAHNGDSFDVKRSNARFLFHKLPPPSTYKTVDTLKVAKKNFKFDGNSLSDICRYLGIGKKVPHVGFALWKGCMAGDEAAWEIMKEYNAHDVQLLEEVYLRLRPWSAHPDVTLYDGAVRSSRNTSGDHPCPTCGSHHTQKRGITVAKTRRYQRWNCQNCGTWFQGDIIKDK